jgi:drug/metabolite transporter (DMT)-like permease
MKPVSPAPEGNDDSRPDADPQTDQHLAIDQPAIQPAVVAGPLETLQRRYADQLSEDIEGLEAEKAELQADIATLRTSYERLESELRAAKDAAEDSAKSSAKSPLQDAALPPVIGVIEREPLVKPPLIGGPRLPGEPPVEAPPERLPQRSIDLPTPATSEQRRQQGVQLKKAASQSAQVSLRKGMMLSAIAALLMAWHYCLVSALTQGGSWLGLEIGQLGLGFVPAVALLWLRMLVTVPVLVLLAPQLYPLTWEDLQEWSYTRDQLLMLLIGSGVALFFSQALLYLSMGSVGAAVGAALLFLYPLTLVPMGLLTRQERNISPLAILAMVAIAMGGLLIVRPALSVITPTALWLGILASAAFSLYVLLTNMSYRQQCHPVPVGVVQFSTVAVLSSLVLLVKPLKLVNISWLSFAIWGLLLGVAMLLVYLFNYSSLRLIGSRTAIVAATIPVVTLVMAWGFTPKLPLEIIQWTGILLVSIGGIALGNEKLSSDKR